MSQPEPLAPLSLAAMMMLAVFFIGVLVGYLAWNPELRWNQKEAVIETTVDTVYAPPPGFSDAFNLRCYWIKDEGS